MVLFEPHEVVKEVQVAIIQDDVVEGTEVFTATLMAGTGVTIGRNGLATTTITDDDSKLLMPYRNNIISDYAQCVYMCTYQRDIIQYADKVTTSTSLHFESLTLPNLSCTLAVPIKYFYGCTWICRKFKPHQN